MIEQVAWGRLAYGLLAFLAGFAGSYWGQPLIHGNTDAISLIVTVYSILAGLLIAVITVLGNSELIVRGSWRSAAYSKQAIKRRLLRHRLLFKIYLTTLFLIFVSMLLGDKLSTVKAWLEHTYLFLAIVAFVMSMSLPSSLLNIQEEMLDSEIERRRSEAGISEKG